MVRFFRAALAAFLISRFAAARCFFVVISFTRTGHSIKVCAWLAQRAAAASFCVRDGVAAGAVAAEAFCVWAYDLRPPRVTLVSQRRRLRVRAAFFAAAERDRAERCRATRFACFDNACLDAERRLSRLSARFVARERFRDGFVRPPARPFVRSRFAWRFVRSVPRFGGGNFIPARRAFDKPMAMACSGERAPCSPSRICSISSRTNSPAWVLGDLPSRSSSRARSIASSSGITNGFRLWQHSRT